MIINHVDNHPAQETFLAQSGLAVDKRWVMIGVAVDDLVHGKAIPGGFAGPRPGFALEWIGQEVAELVVNRLVGNKDVGQPVHL